MSNEGTDINTHGNGCICIRCCDQVSDESTETYASLLHIENRDAESIFNYIVADLTKVRFVTLDLEILYTHCQAHAWELVVESAADAIPDIFKSLSTIKSLLVTLENIYNENSKDSAEALSL